MFITLTCLAEAFGRIDAVPPLHARLRFSLAGAGLETVTMRAK